MAFVHEAAMSDQHFWKLIEGLEHSEDFRELKNRLEKLSWKKLLGYTLKMHLLIGNRFATETNDNGVKSRSLVKILIENMLAGREKWDSNDMFDVPEISDSAMDYFINLVHEVNWDKHVVNSKSIMGNPAALGNQVFDLDRFARVGPSWYIGPSSRSGKL